MDPNDNVDSLEGQDVNYDLAVPGEEANPDHHNWTEEPDGTITHTPPGFGAAVGATNFSYPTDVGPPSTEQQTKAYQNWIMSQLNEAGVKPLAQPVGASGEAGATGASGAETLTQAGTIGPAGAVNPNLPTATQNINEPSPEQIMIRFTPEGGAAKYISIGDARQELIEAGAPGAAAYTPQQVQAAYALHEGQLETARKTAATNVQKRADALAKEEADRQLTAQGQREATRRTQMEVAGRAGTAAAAEAGAASRQRETLAAQAQQAQQGTQLKQQELSQRQLQDERQQKFQTAIALLQHSTGMAGAGNLRLAMQLLSQLLGINIPGAGQAETGATT